MSKHWVPLSEARRLPAVSGLYVIRHRESGKEYVGQSRNVRKRLAGHGRYDSPMPISAAIRKYGRDAFDACLWAEVPVEQLGDAEIALIAERGTFGRGYNASAGGRGPTGVVWAAERRAAQSSRVKGVPLGDEHREKIRLSALENNAFRGKTHTDEAKRKIAEANVLNHTGLKRSAEARANISASLKGRAAPYVSPESRARAAAALRGVAKPGSSQSGERNGMYGRRGAENALAKSVEVVLVGGVVMRFVSATEAAAHFGVKVCSVADWCRGRYQPKNGHTFRYK